MQRRPLVATVIVSTMVLAALVITALLDDVSSARAVIGGLVCAAVFFALFLSGAVRMNRRGNTDEREDAR